MQSWIELIDDAAIHTQELPFNSISADGVHTAEFNFKYINKFYQPFGLHRAYILMHMIQSLIEVQAGIKLGISTGFS